VSYARAHACHFVSIADVSQGPMSGIPGIDGHLDNDTGLAGESLAHSAATESNQRCHIVIVPHRRRRCDAANCIGGLDAMAMVRCRIDAAS